MSANENTITVKLLPVQFGFILGCVQLFKSRLIIKRDSVGPLNEAEQLYLDLADAMLNELFEQGQKSTAGLSPKETTAAINELQLSSTNVGKIAASVDTTITKNDFAKMSAEIAKHGSKPK